MRVTTWAEYGLIVSIHLARRAGEGPVAARELSEHVTFEVNCDLHPVDPARCSPDASCSIRPVWRLLERRINDLLAGITLADLMHQEAQIYQIVGVTAET